MQWLRAFGLPIAAVVLLGACGGDDADRGGDDASTATATSPATSDEAGPTATSTSPEPTAAPTSTARGAVQVTDLGALGAVLTNAEGRTLYIFTNDTPGKSVCNGSCATAWPPLEAAEVPVVPGAPGQFTLITRDDGASQVAYDGKPLYTYTGDQKAGDGTGEGVGGVWFAARATAANSGSGAQPTTASSTGSDQYGY